jgi:hypothetical protein
VAISFLLGHNKMLPLENADQRRQPVACVGQRQPVVPRFDLRGQTRTSRTGYAQPVLPGPLYSTRDHDQHQPAGTSSFRIQHEPG